MVMKFLALFLCIGGVLCGCAGPAAFETVATEGHIVSRKVGDGGPSGSVSQTVVIPAGAVFIPLNVTTSKQTSPYYLYTIKYDSEHELITQSASEFQIGECVRLWHAPLAESTGVEYKFVAGTLERFIGCK